MIGSTLRSIGISKRISNRFQEQTGKSEETNGNFEEKYKLISFILPVYF